ncbi:hypothetical protein GALL_158610 [mine drainage metagenome]|uniref:DUF2202 domain-containing protein n=1 Tax=mine drainage metagenome TaxID=410659 RepID=A0A1J5S1W7_9ZZZZ
MSTAAIAFQSPLHQALCEALDDEYKARATYYAVIRAFGPVLPFANIIQSEQRHINMLLGVLDQRGLAAIDDPYGPDLPAPASLEEAYRAGVDAEIENVALYDRLLAAAEGDETVRWVFRSLQRASQECHLPAFQRFLDGGAEGGAGGCGGGHRHQHGEGGGGCGCGGHRRQSAE